MIPERMQTPQLIGIVPWISGRYYDGMSAFGGDVTSALPSINVAVATPILVVGSRNRGAIAAIDRLGIYVTTLHAAKVARLGLYDSATDGRPGTLVVDGGEVSVATTGLKTVTVSASLVVGNVYWRVIWGNGTPTLSGETNRGSLNGSPVLTFNNNYSIYSSLQTYSAGVSVFPSTFFSDMAADDQVPVRIGVRAV